jgi:hypothetical protein
MNSPMGAGWASHRAKPGNLPVSYLLNTRASLVIDMDQALAAAGGRKESKRYGCKAVKMML